GPSRACISAMTLRSINTMYPATSGSTATITTAQTNCTQMDITKLIRVCIALAVDFSQNDIERPDDRHNVRHQVSANHFVERLEVDQRRRANAHAGGLRRAIADDVISELALRRFDGVVDLARRRLQYLADLAHDRPGGNVLNRL